MSATMLAARASMAARGALRICQTVGVSQPSLQSAVGGALRPVTGAVCVGMRVDARGYAAPAKGDKKDKGAKKGDKKKKGAPALRKAEPPVIPDPLLVTGLNVMKDGRDPPLRPDSEYPDWLWSLADPLPPSGSLTPSDAMYWRVTNRIKIRQRNLELRK
eukprot:Opistho-2@61763